MQTETSSLAISVDLTIEVVQFAPAEEFTARSCFSFADEVAAK